MKSSQRQELYFYTTIIKVGYSYNLQLSLNCIGKVKWEAYSMRLNVCLCVSVCVRVCVPLHSRRANIKRASSAATQRDCIF